MTSPHFLVLRDRPGSAHIEAQGELWAPDVVDLRTRMLTLVADGCRTIELDLSRASPGYLADVLLSEVVVLTSRSCTVTVGGWQTTAVLPELADVR